MKRAVLYMTPAEGYFRVGLALGEKAAHAALDSDLPTAILEIVDTAPTYAEG
jgi:hypothetical protein